MQTIEPDQIWQEDYPYKAPRFVRVISVGDDTARIRTCGEDGVFKAGTRIGHSLRSRFGKKGGYRFVMQVSAREASR